MNEIKINFYIFLLFFGLISYTLNEIRFPFKTEIISYNENISQDISNYVNNLIHNNIYIELEIGTPKAQKVNSFLKFEEYPFFIQGKDIPTSKFNENESSTYKSEKLPLYFLYGEQVIKEGFVSSDSFSININKRMNKDFFSQILKVDEISFVYVTKTITESPSNIGLMIPSEFSSIPDITFITQFKKKGLIDFYSFVLNYTSENEGEFIVGGPPHLYDEKYNLRNYFTVNAIKKPDFWSYAIKFKSITFGNSLDNIKDSMEGKFLSDFGLIVGTHSYRDLVLETFFNHKIMKGDCFQGNSTTTIEWREGEKLFKYFYCKKKSVDISKLEKVRFIHNELNYTFELTYKDLFYETQHYYIFKVIFLEFQHFYWIFGKPWLSKYLMVFDQDSKIVGHYSSIGNVNEIINGKNMIFQWIIFGIVFTIALIIGGLLIYFLIFKNKRKIRINELEEYFDYESAESSNNKRYDYRVSSKNKFG